MTRRVNCTVRLSRDDAHAWPLARSLHRGPAAYSCLAETRFGVRPPYGILHYPNRTYAIDYTRQLETSLRALLEEIRSQERSKEVDRSHDQAARCARCGFRSICDQVLRG